MLLRKLYIMSLEHPGCGFFGVLGQVGSDPSLKDLDLYIRGYLDSEVHFSIDLNQENWYDFSEWLREKDYFPPIGWAGKIIEDTGDGQAAFDKFKALLFEFLETHTPDWFITFNLQKQPSPWWGLKVKGDSYENAECVPKKEDIRIQKHIDIAINQK